MTTSAVAMTRPASSEHAPYYERYTTLVPDLATSYRFCNASWARLLQLLRGIDDASRLSLCPGQVEHHNC